MKLNASVIRCLARLGTPEFAHYRQYIDGLMQEALMESGKSLDNIQIRRAQGKVLILERLASEIREGEALLQKLPK